MISFFRTGGIGLAAVYATFGMLVSLTPCTGATFGNFSYEVVEGGVEITDYPDDASGKVLIPSEIDGLPVTSIGEGAFASCEFISEVVMPESVTSIGTAAFAECSSIVKSINIPSGVTHIGPHAFVRCRRIPGNITIPSGVETIASGTFEHCNGLSGITISEGVRTVESGAFWDCRQLERIVLPATIEAIEPSAFVNCEDLKELIFLGDAPGLQEGSLSGFPGQVSFLPGASGFLESGPSGTWGGVATHVLQSPSPASYLDYEIDGAEVRITRVSDEPDQDLEIPAIIEGKLVTTIGVGAFQACEGITSIRLPFGINMIESSAFQGCTALQGITFDGDAPRILPDSFDGIETGDFTSFFRIGASGFTSGAWQTLNTASYSDRKFLFQINDGSATMLFAPAETCIEIPSSTQGKPVTGLAPFSGVGNGSTPVTNIVIPSSVTSIGEAAFSGTDLVEVDIPESVTFLGPSVFDGCESLRQVKLPSGISTLPEGIFESCESLVGLEIPNSISEIGSSAFSRCHSLKSLSIPDGVQSIGERTFASCSSLEAIDLPLGLTSVGPRAFFDCTRLEVVEFPKALSTIDFGAFTGCRNLRSAIFDGAAPVIEGGAFSQVSEEFSIYYLKGSAGFTSPTWQDLPSVELDLSKDPASIWLLGNCLSYDSDLQADINDDGVSLLMAYALNLDPKQNLSGSLPFAKVRDGQMSLDFNAAARGIEYMVESSNDLIGWSSDKVSLSELDPEGQRTATVSVESPQMFLRLNVKEQTNTE